MENLQIGNWLVNSDGIEWTGIPYNGYYIDKNRLLQQGLECENAYDWLLHLAHKNWLTEQDIYALNTAFAFALDKFIPYYRRKKLSFANTLNEQQKIIQCKNTEPNKGVAWSKILSTSQD